jgi:CDP-diacylglycerol--glycerol-3-phosphate 3-phosphatidyltransferase
VRFDVKGDTISKMTTAVVISNQQVLKTLRLKWGFAGACGLFVWLISFTWLRTWWEPPYTLRWLLMSGLALGYLLYSLWGGLTDNHRPGEKNLLPTFGLGNRLSILRGFIMALFIGFLFSPWPGPGWEAWLPGLLYTLAVLPDFVDGIAARLTNHITRLGETLDISIDSLGVLGVSVLAVQYGQVPWWFLFVGLARYFFLAGIWLREKRNLPVFDLPFSVRRRGYAALAMGLFLVILYPVFKPPLTHIAAAVFAAYILGGFLWDWLLAIGWLPPHPGELYRRIERIIVQVAPLLLRVVLLLWLVIIQIPDLFSEQGSWLVWVETGAVLCLILGVIGRISAIVALVALGFQHTGVPLDSAALGLLVLCANLLFLGTGAFSLWPVEDRLIFRRVGDQG